VASCVFAQNQPTQQNQEPAEGQAADQYFSGTVVSYSEEKVTVERTVLGKNSSLRNFTLTAQTQIDGLTDWPEHDAGELLNPCM
jgi:hypothetical protein